MLIVQNPYVYKAMLFIKLIWQYTSLKLGRNNKSGETKVKVSKQTNKKILISKSVFNETLAILHSYSTTF